MTYSPYDNQQDEMGQDEMERRALLREMQRAQPNPNQPAPSAPPATGPVDLNSYDRRGGPGGHRSAMGSAVSGMSTGATVGSVVPVLGTAVGAGLGAAIGGIKGLAQRRAATAPTDFMLDDATDALQRSYQQHLGRAASQDEINSQLGGQGWQSGDRYVGEAGLTSVLDSIRNSEEARNYRTNGPAAPAAPAAPPTTTPPPARESMTPQGVWAKYSQGRNVGSGRTNDPVTQKFWQDMKADYEGHGYKMDLMAHPERSDKVTITGPDGRPIVVDGIYAAGGNAGDQRAQWLVEDGTSRPSRPMGGMDMSSSSIRGLVPTDTDFYNKLQAQLQGILGPEAFDRDALLRMLGGK